MYYQFIRVKRKNREQTTPNNEPFSGWVSTWNGKIKETSHALAKFEGQPVDDLIQWATRNGIHWSVTEKQ